jgi:hypothetical protein
VGEWERGSGRARVGGYRVDEGQMSGQTGGDRQAAERGKEREGKSVREGRRSEGAKEGPGRSQQGARKAQGRSKEGARKAQRAI